LANSVVNAKISFLKASVLCSGTFSTSLFFE